MLPDGELTKYSNLVNIGYVFFTRVSWGQLWKMCWHLQQKLSLFAFTFVNRSICQFYSAFTEYIITVCLFLGIQTIDLCVMTWGCAQPVEIPNKINLGLLQNLFRHWLDNAGQNMALMKKTAEAHYLKQWLHEASKSVLLSTH